MKKTSRVTFRLNKTTYQKMEKAIINDGHNKRQKSKWISKAIESMLNNCDFVELVELEENAGERSDYPYGISLSKELHHALEKAVIECRKQVPTLSNVKSSIIRVAIKQRLLRRVDTSLPGEQNVCD